MANMRLCRLVLDDKWPGVAQHADFPVRTSACGTNGKGWDNTIDNYSSADDTARALNAGPYAVPLGSKRQAYTDNTNCPGYYTMMYLCYHSFCDGLDISKDFSDGNFFCAPAAIGCASCSEWADTSVGPYHVVSRCYTAIASDATKAGRIAIPCSTHIYSDGTGVNAAGYGDGYGWFWVGGVCPCKDATILDDETGDQKGVDLTCQCDRGAQIIEITTGLPMLMPDDMSNMADATGSVGSTTASIAIGWTCASAA